MGLTKHKTWRGAGGSFPAQWAGLIHKAAPVYSQRRLAAPGFGASQKNTHPRTNAQILSARLGLISESECAGMPGSYRAHAGRLAGYDRGVS